MARARPAARPALEGDRHERLVVGLQPVREAIRAHGARVSKVMVLRGGAGRQSPRLEAVARFARDRGITRVERVSRRDLDALAGADTAHQGVAALAPALTLHDWEPLARSPGLLAVALDAIQDPQNFGAVIRSAVGLADAVVLWGEHASAPLGLATARASAGAIEHARLCRVRSLTGALQVAREAGASVVGLDAHAPRPLGAVDLTGPTVIVVGGEHTGLGRAVRHACTELATLVRPRSIEALNASVAAAIALYEATNQRAKSGD